DAKDIKSFECRGTRRRRLGCWVRAAQPRFMEERLVAQPEELLITVAGNLLGLLFGQAPVRLSYDFVGARSVLREVEFRINQSKRLGTRDIGGLPVLGSHGNLSLHNLVPELPACGIKVLPFFQFFVRDRLALAKVFSEDVSAEHRARQRQAANEQ